MKNKLTPPCAYQGGKQRLNVQILDIIDELYPNIPLVDLCSGSGAVGLEAFNRGRNITMVDKGCYGAFWESLYNNSFDLEVFKSEIDKIPSIENIQTYLKEISSKPVDFNKMVYHYLLLQAGAFGSKQIWLEGDKWKNCSFRSFWQPTETSNRRSVVNPMMPMPYTLYERVETIFNNLDKSKFQAYCMDVIDFLDNNKNDFNNKVIYIDPPYKNTLKYGHNVDINKVIDKIDVNTPLFISEGYKMDNATASWCLSKGRSKGNISGDSKKKPVEEWLNLFVK